MSPLPRTYLVMSSKQSSVSRSKLGVGGSGKNTTWFVMYAPAKKPQLAMAVYMEKSGGYGASVAGIVAQHIVADYFGVKIAPIGP